MNGSQIVLYSLADEELLAAIRAYGFELYKDITEVSVKRRCLSLYANLGVTLAAARGVYGDPIVEYVIGGMLCMGKRLLVNYSNSWRFLFNRSLAMDSRMNIELSKASVRI